MLHWIEKKRKIEELLHDIKMSLPSRRMYEIVSIGAINYKGKTVIFKSRYEERDLPIMLLQNPPILYKTAISDPNYPYNELLTKNVIFDTGILRRRGIDALDELIRLCDGQLITKYSY